LGCWSKEQDGTNLREWRRKYDIKKKSTKFEYYRKETIRSQVESINKETESDTS